MKYILHCLLRGEIEEYHHDLVNQIAKKFNLKITKEENLKTHLTLKYPFETNNIEEIERICKEFCQAHKKTLVKLEGFGTFPSETVFINATLSKEAKETFEDLIKELRKIKWMPWNEYDAENLHFHSTIAERCGEQFPKVIDFIKGKERSFNCKFDNITILKLISGTEDFGKWKVHKIFSMQ